MLPGIYFIVFAKKYSYLNHFIKILKENIKKKMNNATEIFLPEAQLVYTFFFCWRCIVSENFLCMVFNTAWFGDSLCFPLFFCENHRKKFLAILILQCFKYDMPHRELY